MRLSQALTDALNDQITLELKASTTYLQLAIELEAQDLTGMSSWMRAQAEEEQEHAAKFIAHALDRGATPKIGTIAAPGVTAVKPIELFEAALAHEELVSEAIRNLYRLAQSEGDLDIVPLLNWFIDEQVEEESTVSEIIGRLNLIGGDGSGLLRMDAELGSRSPSISADGE